MAPTASHGKKRVPIDAGIQPTMEEYIALAEPAIREGMLDPDAAQIQFPYGLILGDDGFYTCISVNGKNAYGAYTGFQFATVGVAQGIVTYVAKEGREFFVDITCRQMIKHGQLPLAN